MSLELSEFEEKALAWGIEASRQIYAEENRQRGILGLSNIDEEAFKLNMRNAILSSNVARQKVDALVSAYMNYLGEAFAIGSQTGRTRQQ